MNVQQKILQAYFGVYSTMAPRPAAKKGFRLFQKVRKKDIREREEDFFERARAFQVPVVFGDNHREDIFCYELGDAKNDLVILVHGWDSNAGSMSQIAYQLVEKGKYVILFNLPAHAFSPSHYTNMLECRLAMTAVLDHIQPKPGFSIVSHSFGSAVTAYTLSKNKYELDKLIFLTNPNRVERIFTDFKNAIGLNDKAYNELLKLTTEKLGEPIEAVSVEKNLKQVDFGKLLLIHDKNDKVLPYYNSQEVNEAIPNSNLLTFENIGHYKMLWNKDVIENCTDFLCEASV